MAAQVAIRIGRILLAAVPFAEKAAHVSYQTPTHELTQYRKADKRCDIQAKDKEPKDPPSNVTDKYRWLQCTVRNATDFPILAQSTYWSSGRYEGNPGRVDAFEIGTFSACNGDNTVMTGVSGGQSYKIEVDETHSFEFSIVSLTSADSSWGDAQPRSKDVSFSACTDM